MLRRTYRSPYSRRCSPGSLAASQKPELLGALTGSLELSAYRVGIALLIVGILSDVVAVAPRLRTNPNLGVGLRTIYFGDIRRYSADELAVQYRSRDQLEALCSSIVRGSQICWRKHRPSISMVGYYWNGADRHGRSLPLPRVGVDASSRWRPLLHPFTSVGKLVWGALPAIGWLHAFAGSNAQRLAESPLARRLPQRWLQTSAVSRRRKRFVQPWVMERG